LLIYVTFSGRCCCCKWGNSL